MIKKLHSNRLFYFILTVPKGIGTYLFLFRILCVSKVIDTFAQLIFFIFFLPFAEVGYLKLWNHICSLGF